MYLPILTLRTSGIPRCRIASRTALPCGSSTAAFGITITFAFIISRYLSASTRTSAIRQKLRSFPTCLLLKTTSSVPSQRARSWIEDDWRATNLRIQSPRNLNHCTDFISAGRGHPGSLTPSVLAHDVARLFIFAQAEKDWCTQFSIARPLCEFDFTDERRIDPMHFAHDRRGDSLNPLAVLF